MSFRQYNEALHLITFYYRCKENSSLYRGLRSLYRVSLCQVPLYQETKTNRPFPSSLEPLYQNEVKCSAFDMEIIFHSHANKTHFHKKGCTLGLILKVRVFGTRKWPIGCVFLGENLKTDFRSQIIWILYYLKNGRSEKG